MLKMIGMKQNKLRIMKNCPVTLPRNAIYLRTTQHYLYGRRYFQQDRYNCVVVAEKPRTYRIQLPDGAHSYVGKEKIKFQLLAGSYCEYRQRYIPRGGCKICFNRFCDYSGKFLPAD